MTGVTRWQRWFLALAILVAGALPAIGPAEGPAAEAAPPVAADTTVYFAETGHTLGGPFWQFWRTRGALDVFGYPLTEPFVRDGVAAQWFQRARFELWPEAEGVLLALLGDEVGAAQVRIAEPEVPLPDGERYYAQTGHTVSGAILNYYLTHGAHAIFGYPIGEALGGQEGAVQWFQRARLEWSPDTGVQVGLLGQELVGWDDVDTAPLAQPPSVPEWWPVHTALVEHETRLAEALSRTGFSVPLELGAKWIEISIAGQRITAWEGERPVFSDLVSTGKAGKGFTPRGVFAIQRRVANETMDSSTIGFPPGHPLYYRLENVLYTQYFTSNGVAIHYAWWHNNFGQPMSFGCVNLRLPTARWFWDWVRIGTKVIVY